MALTSIGSESPSHRTTSRPRLRCHHRHPSVASRLPMKNKVRGRGRSQIRSKCLYDVQVGVPKRVFRACERYRDPLKISKYEEWHNNQRET